MSSHIPSIESLVNSHSSEYLVAQSLKFFLFTWNVANWKANKMCQFAFNSLFDRTSDMIIICLQELDMSVEGIAFNESKNDLLWIKEFSKVFGKDFLLVKRVMFGSVLMLVYRKKIHQSLIKSLHVSELPTGLLGVMANKGAVGISFIVHETRICIVGSHLSAGASDSKRNKACLYHFMMMMMMKLLKEYEYISSNMTFQSFQNKDCKFEDHDIIFWMGDLNYRIQNLEIPQVLRLIAQKEYSTLLAHDQLLQCIKNSVSFQNYQESPINFAPTYKFVHGTSEYTPIEKDRTPSYCDRILWKVREKDSVKSLLYENYPSLSFSDHKPVLGSFAVTVYEKDVAKYQKVYEKMLQLQKIECNSLIPNISINNITINFDNVQFMERCERSITLTNTCEQDVKFQLISNDGRPASLSPWLKIEPISGTIKYKKSIDLAFYAYIDQNSIHQFFEINEREDIYVIHLIGGCDYFICVMIKFQPKIFGRNLENSCIWNSFLQSSTSDSDSVNADEEDASSTSLSLSSPVEVMVLLTKLHMLLVSTMTESHDYMKVPSQRQVQKLVRHFESSDYLDISKMPPISSSVVFRVLLLYFECLPEPLLTDSAVECLKENCHDFKKIVSTLPYCHERTVNQIVVYFSQYLPLNVSNQFLVEQLTQILFGSRITKGQIDVKTSTKISAHIFSKYCNLMH